MMFVNEYKLTEDILCETMSTWFDRKHKKEKYILYCLGVIMGVFSVISQDIAFIVLTVLVVVAIVMLFINRRQGLQLEKERAKAFCESSSPIMKIELDDKICVSTATGSKDVAYSMVKHIVESKNLIVLILRDEMTIALKKDSFIQGDADACIEYLTK